MARGMVLYRHQIDSFLGMDEPRRKYWRGGNDCYSTISNLFESRGWLLGRFERRPVWAQHLQTHEARTYRFGIDFADMPFEEKPSLQAQVTYQRMVQEKGVVRIQSVYMISDGQYTKIGIATHPLERLSDLMTANPRKMRVIASATIDDAKKVERQFHKEFRNYKRGGEWFELTRQQQQEIASRLIDLALSN